MPNRISTYLRTTLLDAVLRGVPFTPPTTVYVALYSTSPTDDDAGAELVGGSYARQPVTFGAPSGSPPTALSDVEVDFPVATAAWNGGAPIGYAGVRDALTLGNLLFWGPLTVPIVVPIGKQVTIAIGKLACRL